MLLPMRAFVMKVSSADEFIVVVVIVAVVVVIIVVLVAVVIPVAVVVEIKGPRNISTPCQRVGGEQRRMMVSLICLIN